ncbi:hypothetical protein B0H14DRAFT_3081334 [Mycena olivaceomarginata]|nr:hypothetical protein B0H14DRAFT_3081334 [Mycena olivaceomarginata]
MPGNPLLKGKTNGANNSEGRNGTENGTWPEEDVLGESLHEYARLGDPLLVRRRKLLEDHGLQIGGTTLKNLNTYFNVGSVRKPIPHEVADQKILNKMDNDAHKYREPNTVKRNLALAGVHISRRIIRETMHLNDPDGVDARYPGRKKIKRAQLKAHGTWQEIHCDSHEKLGALALQMGGVGLPIYGMKDKWGAEILYLVVIPDDRHSDVIGHVFLDFVELYGAIPQQATVDKGSETGHMYAIMTGLKTAYAPDIDLTRYPVLVTVKSTNNTPIEDEGIFNPNNSIHVLLFNWIWPPIFQGELDHFTERWNSHVIRRQSNKLMPSGVSPNELYAHPEYYGGRCFAIPVPKDAAALSWVPEEFDTIAWQVYEMLGSPLCSAETAWDVFSQMASVMC